jgi:drug/metabolite transporter (DMT)-like permease
MTTKLTLSKEFKADLSLLFITLIWGASYPLMSLVVRDIHPFSFVAVRYLFSGLILAAFCFKKLRRVNKATWIAALVIGGTLGIGCILQLTGLLYTTPSKSGFITGSCVIFVPIFMAFFYRRFPDIKTVIAVILSITGLWFISMNQGAVNINYGDMLTLLCAAVFALQIIAVDKFANNVDIMVLTCLEMFVTGIIAIPPAIIVEKFDMHITWFTAAAMLLLIILGSVVGHTLQNKMQPFTDPSHAAVIYLAEPVFGAFFSALTGDRLTGKALIGCVLIFSGMAIINIWDILNRKAELKKVEVEID